MNSSMFTFSRAFQFTRLEPAEDVSEAILSPRSRVKPHTDSEDGLQLRGADDASR